MPLDWINDDLTFTDGFEQNLDPQVRDYAKGFKDLNAALKSGMDSRTQFRTRVQLPTTEEDKRKFMDEHFKDMLDADAKKREETATAEKQQAEQKAASDKQRAEEERLSKAKEKVATILGTETADTNRELCRRAFRGDFCPAWIKAAVATLANVKPEEITDDQFNEIAMADPAVVETLLKIGDLTKDGRTERGDGHQGKDVEERQPAYPHQPDYYRARPDDDPEKLWFINRGAKYEGGRYVGGFATQGAAK